MLRLSAVLSLLVALSGTAFSQTDSSFPSTLCASLPKMAAADAASLQSHFPDLQGGDMREVTASAAESMLDKTVDKVSALELFTEEPARGNCVFSISDKVLADIDSKYDLVLLTPFTGKDTDGKDFRMTELVIGKSQLYEIYDRDGIHFKDPQSGNSITMKGIIREKIPAAGTLELNGVSSPFGPINRLRQVSATQVEVRVLLITQDYPLKNITRRAPAPPAPVAEAEGASLALAYLQSLPSAERITAWMDSH